MAYVPGFEYDLFLSYASDDFDERLAGLVRDLQVYLRRELGKDFSQDRGIFLDRNELNYTPVAWKQRLAEGARSAAILVPIVSPGYATSDYCAKEWEWFAEHPPLLWPTGTETVYRICPVRWRALDQDLLEQLAPEIRAAQEDRTLSAEELGLKLANGLRAMRRSRQMVYLGESDHEIRRRVRDEISRIGLRVVPEAASAYGNPEIVRRFLSEAHLAVHFVGNQQSQRAINAIRWSREYCRNATVLYEIPGVDLTAEERVQLEWLEEDIAKASAADSRAYDRVSGKSKNLDQFLEVLRDRLEGVRPLPATQVGIACEELDRAAAEAIIPEIQSRTGFTAVCHGESILEYKKSRGILLYWGEASGTRLLRARPILRAYYAFFLAPPPKPEDAKAQLAGCQILHQMSERFRVEDIRPFLAGLGWKG